MDARASQPGYRNPANTVPAPRISGVHHSAWRCRDAAETRWFYETVCGLPLEAALTFDKEPGTGNPLRYMHLFFRMADGNYIAFFDLPDTAKEEYFRRRSGFNLHFAMEVKSRAELDAFKRRWEDHGIEAYGPIDHHFCHSIYTFDPNGIQVEVTWRDPEHDTIMAREHAEAERLMDEWNKATGAAKAGKLNVSQVVLPAQAAE